MCQATVYGILAFLRLRRLRIRFSARRDSCAIAAPAGKIQRTNCSTERRQGARVRCVQGITGGGGRQAGDRQIGTVAAFIAW
jgi:hypothetical protein